jgi:tungstate transport system substrate-binding protein
MTRLGVGLGIALVAVCGCHDSETPTKTLTLATTTSMRDSGLLDVLAPMFEEQTGIAIKVVAVGSGQALEMGRRGDVDVLLTHAPAAEEQFVAAGYGERRPMMFNDFVVVGPESDSAEILGEKSICAAFAKIADSKSTFISRGDNSGTHMKEELLWERTEVAPSREWHLETGSGMAATLRVANEKQAYTMCDRSTFLALRSGFDLTILSEGDPLLSNEYSVTIISQSKHPHVKIDLAEKLADFLVAPATQRVIAEFGKDQFGEQLFFPHGD